MTAPNLEQPDDADIDASLTLDGFDASDRYPEYGHSALRAAYRLGWADVVAAIRDSGYTVIATPEPHGRWALGPEWVQGANLADRSGWVAWTAEGAGMVMLQRVEPGELTPDDAADLGAALIAAAKHAGDTQ